MDRTIVYPGSVPLDTDVLNLNRNTMIAVGALIRAVLGTSPVIDGLAVTPTSPPSLAVQVAPGAITNFGALDPFAYGSLGADGTNGLAKMGINISVNIIAVGAPTGLGTSIVSVIEAAFEEADVNPVALPYYNAAFPSQAWLGPNNTGQAQATQRIQRVKLRARAGDAAATGAQTPPDPMAGWYPLAYVTTAHAQTQISDANVAAASDAPFIPFKLQDLRPGFSNLQAFATSGNFIVPHGVSQVRVRAIGGGGGGGGNTTQGGGGGGGGGGYAEMIVPVVAGQSVPVTVGAGGTGGANAGGSGAGNNGQPGGTTAFGTAFGAGGGQGGGGSLSGGQGNSGPGGSGLGGAINMTGGAGNAGFSVGPNGFGGHGAGAACGGGGGAASSGLPSAGASPGGGGAGGGGNFAGAPGAAGAVFVEF